MISIRRFLAEFFTWWGAELAACVPSRLTDVFRPRRCLTLIWLGNEVLLRWTAHRETIELGRMTTDAPESLLQAEFARIIASVPYNRAEVAIELPPERVLRREVALPSAAAENLREVLGFEMDRLTPFKSEDAAFDYRIKSLDRITKRMTVSLAVAPRALIAQIDTFAATIGLVPDRITTFSEIAGGKRSFDLGVSNRVAPQNTKRQRLTFSLAVAAVVLVVLATWLPLQRKKTVLLAYEARLAELRPIAVEAADLREQIRAKAEQGSFIVRHRSETLLVVSVLKEITDRLADDSWLMQFRLSGLDLTLAGYAPKATSLVPVLEGSPQLTDVKFSAPVMPEPTINKDRFGIVARVTGQ